RRLLLDTRCGASVLNRKHQSCALDGTIAGAVHGRMRAAEAQPSPHPLDGRSLLVERAAAALAHEAKNPLHNMALHLQLVSEKLPREAAQAIERHLNAMRNGIAQVDTLLKAFADLVGPADPAADLG